MKTIYISDRLLKSFFILTLISLIFSCKLFSPTAVPEPQPQEEPQPVVTEDTAIYIQLEDPPTFPGGYGAMRRFIAENLVYPEQAIKDTVEGVVYIQFVVEKDGSLSNFSVIRGIGEACDQEAIRIIRMMPKWNPGKQRLKLKRGMMRVAVDFTLD